MSEGIILAEKSKEKSLETRLLMYKSWYYTSPAAEMMAFLKPATG
ncbi:MAG TPA: hypothetical protein PKV58_06265 [Kaistella sp.]|nr:hypothetical protein [Kaistella sp.]HPZ25510.1 hypothetical protein [Kaistella sp.]HQD45863.1 hypothetical protein [Kaistella sp.]